MGIERLPTEKRLEAIERYIAKGGGDGDNGDMGTWQLSVENRLGQIEKDIRGLGALGLAATAFLILAYAYGWKNIDTRLDALDRTTIKIENRLDTIQGQTVAIERRLDSADERMERIETVLLQIHEKLP